MLCCHSFIICSNKDLYTFDIGPCAMMPFVHFEAKFKSEIWKSCAGCSKCCIFKWLVQTMEKWSKPHTFLRCVVFYSQRVPRTGWVYRNVKNPESVSDHMYRMAMMSLTITDPTVDRDRCCTHNSRVVCFCANKCRKEWTTQRRIFNLISGKHGAKLFFLPVLLLTIDA